MHEQIDKIQKEVDELIRLCAEGGADELNECLPDDKYSKLGFLLLKLQEGDLEERHFDTLMKWLNSDQEALQYYINFQNLSALLFSHYHPEHAQKVFDQIKDLLAAHNGC
jgi:hypothetical protein